MRCQSSRTIFGVFSTWATVLKPMPDEWRNVVSATPLSTRSACFGLNPGHGGNGMTDGFTAPPVQPAGEWRSALDITAASAAA